ncbi:MAG: hypothetical protein K8S99_18140 [Planctomycetes bacterium]|nr:hypothetical protein [Planctomycetota bacterium]
MGEATHHENVAGGGSTPGIGRGVWCVILSGRGLTLPAKLLEGLTRRGARVSVVADAAAAMVELSQGGHVLVIHEPTTLRRLDELVDAVHRYYPRVLCWRFDSLLSGRPALVRMNGRPPGRGEALYGTMTRAATPAMTPTRTPVAAPARTAKPTHPAADPTGRPPLISREEMDMLLAPLPEPGETHDKARETEGDA